MFKRRVLLLIAAGALPATEAPAQVFGSSELDHDLVSINVFAGGFTPSSDLSDGSEFDTSGSVGGAVTLWLWKYAGIRGNVLYGQPDVDAVSGASIEGEDPDVWLYNGDLMLRLLISAGDAGWLCPYVLGGLGGKTYNFGQDDADVTKFAGNFGAGIEYRVGRSARWGIQAEVRDFISEFDAFGLEDTQHDVVYTAGLSLTL